MISTPRCPLGVLLAWASGGYCGSLLSVGGDGRCHLEALPTMSLCSGRSGGPYLAAATAPVVPAHDVLVVLVLLGQVVEEHALGHRLKTGKSKRLAPDVSHRGAGETKSAVEGTYLSLQEGRDQTEVLGVLDEPEGGQESESHTHTHTHMRTRKTLNLWTPLLSAVQFN